MTRARISKLIIRDALAIVTMDDSSRTLNGYDIEVTGNQITAIGRRLKRSGAKVIDASGKLVLPGFVNTHHHLFQVLTRNLKQAQNVKLFDWLLFHYNIWKYIRPSSIYHSARAAMAELLLTGCTTTSDHLYLVPQKYQTSAIEFFEQQVRAAREIGIRFHLARGSMSRGTSHGGLPPDEIVQDEESILKDSEALIDRFHDPYPLAQIRVFLAPCSPFSVTADLMRESAKLARDKGVMLHTHLCETLDEERYSMENYGKRPFELMEELGWVGSDVWYAHAVHLNVDEIARIGRTQTGIAHCPTSNLRLGSGIAAIPKLLEAGARVGLGVDGSASADSSNMLRELKHTLLIHRIGTGVGSMGANTVLKLATRGGAEVLGRNDIGSIAVGKAADIAIFDLQRLDYAGALSDPAAALLFCGTTDRADTVICNGEVVVRDGGLISADETEIAYAVNRESKRLLRM